MKPFELENKAGTPRDAQKETKEQVIRKILFADDDKVLRMGVTAYLEMLGYQVTEVENGRELLDKLNSSEAFDAVFTDIQMPEMDGITAVEQLRTIPRFAHLPVVVHSGTWTRELERKVEEELKARRLEKPYNFEDLENVMKNIFPEDSEKSK